MPGLVIDAAPQLTLFAFHLEKPGWSIEQQNTATKTLLERVRERGRVFLTGCWISDRFLGRVCVLSFRTHRDRIQDCIEHVAEESARLVA
jgi:aromatic-L-amino-acid decarboxylase